MSESTGRPFNENELLNQIGRGVVAAISGGRFGSRVNEDGEVIEVALPVSNGYRVSIKLNWNDTYTVARQFVRKGVIFNKGTVEGVYCENVGEVAYQASCFRSNEAFGKVSA
jgi:hypothetical protein